MNDNDTINRRIVRPDPLNPRMKIGLVSDFHLEFRTNDEVLYLAHLINSCRGDVVINAGDTHPNKQAREYFRTLIEKPYLEVMGNHDYYGSSLERCLFDIPFGLTEHLVGGSLWTNFRGDPLCEATSLRAIADFTVVKGLDGKISKREFQDTLSLIEEKSPNIVVTHFAPFTKSTHHRYKKHPGSTVDIINGYFVNDLDDWITTLDRPPRLWMHGHTHDPFDYIVNDVRVVCNPLGYPAERKVTDYSVTIIEN